MQVRENWCRSPSENIDGDERLVWNLATDSKHQGQTNRSRSPQPFWWYAPGRASLEWSDMRHMDGGNLSRAINHKTSLSNECT